MSLIKKHHTPKFIVNRFKQLIFEWRYPDAPWLTKEAVFLLDQLIKSSDTGLEFGSGSSTIWLAKRCNFLTSVEHSEKWYNKVKEELNDENVEYLYRNIYKKKYKKNNYFKVINEFNGTSLDFVLIDGKKRDELSLASINKLKFGGLLILDNAERYLPNNFDTPESIGPESNPKNKTWELFYNKISGWRKIWTSNGVTTTLILLKI